ncbi:hypothetical protein HID58_001953 [Brassica napus]|uniref:C2 domain-containing protein n=1 Tax=Brassica napus TaxID=3708 RepID=A0ABQ8EKV8_BRANA|nr:hypothetical protein HID58_001953 [Brassica napus]
MDVYAVVSINDDKKQAAKTPIDYDGGPNPTWNHTIKLTVNEEAAREGRLTLKVELFSYWLKGKDDLYLGDVDISVHELFDSNPLPPSANGNVNKMKSLTFPIKDHSPSIGQPVYPHSDQTTTTKLILEIVIKLAKNIEDVNAFLAMDVYASVAICKDREVKDRINTPVAFSANTNPKWNQKIKFLIDEKLGQEGRLMLLVELMSHRPLLGDKEIGSVRLPIQQLLSSNPPSSSASGDANGMKLETHALTGPYGKKGVVSFTYRFLAEQIRVATVTTPSTTSQPYIMYLPVKPHSNSSSDPVQVTSSYVAVQQGVISGTSNGLVPIYMPPQYPSHEYQQYSPRKQQPRAQPQPPPQHSQVKPLPQQQFSHDVNHVDATDKVDVYAVVSMKGDHTQTKQAAKTPIDYDGGSNPTWNHTIKFSVNEKSACEGLLTIYVKLFSYWLEGENDLYLGEVNVSVQELIASNPPFANGNVNKMKLITYPLSFIGETKPNAKLSLSYRFKPVKDLYPPTPDYLSPFSQPIYPNPNPTGSCQPVIYSPELQTATVTKLAIELVIKCAKDIKKVNVFDEMHVYASVTIREGKKTVKHRSNTPIAFSAYQNPKWDHPVKEQVTVPKPSPSINPQPFIMYLPVSHQGASGYVTVHPGAHDGSSNGLPQPHTHQQQQSKLPPENSQCRPLYDTQPHSYQSYGNQQYSPLELHPQHQLHMPPQQPIEAQPQTEGARPQVKPQGGTMAAIGLGASVLGRVVAGALISDMMSGEANIYEGSQGHNSVVVGDDHGGGAGLWSRSLSVS